MGKKSKFMPWYFGYTLVSRVCGMLGILWYAKVANQFLGYHFDFYGVPPKKGGWGDMCNSRVFVDFPLTKVITIRLN